MASGIKKTSKKTAGAAGAAGANVKAEAAIKKGAAGEAGAPVKAEAAIKKGAAGAAGAAEKTAKAAAAKKTVTAKKETQSKKTSASKTAEKEKIQKNSGKEQMLVIVESPAKSKTIKKILGSSYDIEASFGHIRDFPPKVLGFDAANGFAPEFEVIPEKKAVVKKLSDLAKKADKVFLASDPDREGEAIAWHVNEVLDVPASKVCRIEFNEITPKAVKYAVEHPREIDMNRVKAQQTRQILDRLAGYKISPVLWEKMRNYHLSAGRVQSAALKMICEREDEIKAFTPVEYWTITAALSKGKSEFTAELAKYKNEKIDIKNEEEAQKITDYLKERNRIFTVSKITERNTQRKPSAPFITSTLQREAGSKLGYGVSKTMQIAQKLYEGVDIGSDGPVGLITYMRTDSVRISDDAQAAAKAFITENYGAEYYPETPNSYVKKSRNVQDAHEAVRPSYAERTPESVKQYLTNEQYQLYKLIWSKFIASQMANAEVKNTSIDITAGECLFKTGTSKITFDGYLKLYSDDEEKETASKIPDLKEGEDLKLKNIEPKQHFTSPPPRYSEASLVKALEEHGIGRPSTYAPIISKIQQRNYAEKIDKALAPTSLGQAVCIQLSEHFKDIMNYRFTADMETKLDEIAEGRLVWNDVIKDFYEPFMKTVAEAKQNMKRVLIESDTICPNCGSKMVIRTSRFGTQFLGCSRYPDCKTMLPLNKDGTAAEPPKETDEKCEKCGSSMIQKTGPYGLYLECTNETCRHRKRVIKSTGVTCPKCNEGEIVFKKSKFGKVFFGCNKYPDCDFVSWNEPVNERCPECGNILVKKITKKEQKLVCSNKKCTFEKEMEE